MIDLANVVNLVQAGFSKAEIMAMLKESTPAAPDPKPEPVPAPAPDPKPASAAPAPAPEGKPANDSVTLSDDQFAQLLQKFNLQNDSIDLPPDYDIKQKLSEHFKDVIIGQ